MPRALRIVTTPSIQVEPPRHTHVSLGLKARSYAAAIRATAVRIDALGVAAPPEAIARAKAEADRLPEMVAQWKAEIAKAEASDD